jgi:hypothetical protein
MRKSVFKIENEAELFHDHAIMFTKHRTFGFAKLYNSPIASPLS